MQILYKVDYKHFRKNRYLHCNIMNDITRYISLPNNTYVESVHFPNNNKKGNIRE